MNCTYTQKNESIQRNSESSAASVLDSSSQGESLQRKANLVNSAVQRAEASRPNNTGMPDNLKSGIESLSGFSMDNVRVHYNSSKPATVQALAYTQGTDIHVAPGQEKHLPHEAWHVAQQMAGRVSPTTNINGLPVNDNAALEHEADVMGEKAVQCKTVNQNCDSIDKKIGDSVSQLKPLGPVIYYGERAKRARYMHRFVDNQFPEDWGAAIDYRKTLPYYCTIDELNDATFGERLRNIDFHDYRNAFSTMFEQLPAEEKEYGRWMGNRIKEMCVNPINEGLRNFSAYELERCLGVSNLYNFLCPQALHFLKEKGKKVVFTDSSFARERKMNLINQPKCHVTDAEREELFKGGFLNKRQFVRELGKYYNLGLAKIRNGEGIGAGFMAGAEPMMNAKLADVPMAFLGEEEDDAVEVAALDQEMMHFILSN